ncbi:hypothetical protein ACEUZ9_000852 [Paracoccus litorisediminis]|uniref:hypothetical protein n=1 Tax=Paracoccus litorisediminis TaxID=2006130 RepID=UPI0037348E1B
MACTIGFDELSGNDVDDDDNCIKDGASLLRIRAQEAISVAQARGAALGARSRPGPAMPMTVDAFYERIAIKSLDDFEISPRNLKPSDAIDHDLGEVDIESPGMHRTDYPDP